MKSLVHVDLVSSVLDEVTHLIAKERPIRTGGEL